MMVRDLENCACVAVMQSEYNVPNHQQEVKLYVRVGVSVIE
jgi:hypothetical protein